MNIDIIKNRAIFVRDGMEVMWPQCAKSGKINLKKLRTEGRKKKYSHHNGVIAFVDEEGSLYVIPCLEGVRNTLKEAGYTHEFFWVPFSNYDYPVQEAEQWENLLNELKKEEVE